MYAKWIREGKLKVNSDWNKDLKIKFTVQDPCQLVRKTYGDPVAEDLRYTVKAVVGEENFVEMYPNMSNNYCCGGGGGFLQAGYSEERWYRHSDCYLAMDPSAHSSEEHGFHFSHSVGATSNCRADSGHRPRR